VDYAAKRESASGLLNLAAKIEKDGNTLILDGGDTLQGTPLSQYYLAHSSEYSYQPMAMAFNAVGCDYITLGNHDFNYGYEVIKDYLQALNAKCLCANVRDLRGELGIIPEIVHTLENGLKVGITAVVTDFVNVWEQKENLKWLEVSDAFEAASEAYKRLRPKCDVCVLIYHGGFERDLKSGEILSDSGENIAFKLAHELSYDVLLTGHQHMPVAGINISGTHAVQPPANAEYYAQIDVTVNTDSICVNSMLLPVGESHKDEPFNTMYTLEQAVQDWLDQPVGKLIETIKPEEKLEAALRGSKLAALFNRIQLTESGADFACTSLGNEPIGLSTPVTMRGITAAYLFANTLVVLEVDEDILRAALERCAAYFTLENGVPRVSDAFLKPKIEHYNYDYYAGLSYTFDIRRPVGLRVTKLTRSDGTPLGNSKFKLCTSNYRATGTGGYDALAHCRVLWRGSREMPELVADFIRYNSPLPSFGCGGVTVEW
jgi:2',3'-cyclic-nucleotide 2'-phosphodiesterase/3'-nucleotidase